MGLYFLPILYTLTSSPRSPATPMAHTLYFIRSIQTTCAENLSVQKLVVEVPKDKYGKKWFSCRTHT